MATVMHEMVWGDSRMIRRKLWLHYRTVRFVVELIATLGTAMLVSHWILGSAGR